MSRFRTVVLDLIYLLVLGRLDRHIAICTLLFPRVADVVALSDLLGQLLVLVDNFVELPRDVVVLLLQLSDQFLKLGDCHTLQGALLVRLGWSI